MVTGTGQGDTPNYNLITLVEQKTYDHSVGFTCQDVRRCLSSHRGLRAYQELVVTRMVPFMVQWFVQLGVCFLLLACTYPKQGVLQFSPLAISFDTAGG